MLRRLRPSSISSTTKAFSLLQTRPLIPTTLSNPTTPSSPLLRSSPHQFSRPSSTMADKLTFIEAVAHRRSIYKLTNSLPISDARAQEIVTDAVKHTPSAFDSRTTRIVALLNEDHEKFWEFTTELLRVHVGDEEKFKPTKARMDGFKAAKLTVSASCAMA